MVANTGEKELEDLVRIHVADLGLPPYLELGPGLNALSGRPYYATDLYTNTSWPLGASLLGAPKPKGSAAYSVWEAPSPLPPHTHLSPTHIQAERHAERDRRRHSTERDKQCEGWGASTDAKT